MFNLLLFWRLRWKRVVYVLSSVPCFKERERFPVTVILVEPVTLAAQNKSKCGFRYVMRC